MSDDDEYRWVDDTFRQMTAITFGVATDASGRQALVIVGEDANGIEHRWLVSAGVAAALSDSLLATLDELDH